MAGTVSVFSVYHQKFISLLSRLQHAEQAFSMHHAKLSLDYDRLSKVLLGSELGNSPKEVLTAIKPIPWAGTFQMFRKSFAHFCRLGIFSRGRIKHETDFAWEWLQVSRSNPDIPGRDEWNTSAGNLYHSLIQLKNLRYNLSEIIRKAEKDFDNSPKKVASPAKLIKLKNLLSFAHDQLKGAGGLCSLSDKGIAAFQAFDFPAFRLNGQEEQAALQKMVHEVRAVSPELFPAQSLPARLTLSFFIQRLSILLEWRFIHPEYIERRKFLARAGKTAAAIGLASLFSPFLSEAGGQDFKIKTPQTRIYRDFISGWNYNFLKRVKKGWELIFYDAVHYKVALGGMPTLNMEGGKDALYEAIKKSLPSISRQVETDAGKKIAGILKDSPSYLELKGLYQKYIPEDTSFFEQRAAETLTRMCLEVFGSYLGAYSLDKAPVEDKIEFLQCLHRGIIMSGHPTISPMSGIYDTGSLLWALKEKKWDCDTITMLFVIFGEVMDFPFSFVPVPRHVFLSWGASIEKYPFFFESREGFGYVDDKQMPLKISRGECYSFSGDIACLDALGVYLSSILEDEKFKDQVGEDNFEHYRGYLKGSKDLRSYLVRNYRRDKVFRPGEKYPVAFNFFEAYLAKDAYKDVENYHELREKGYYLRPLEWKKLRSQFYYDAGLAVFYEKGGDITRRQDDAIMEFVKNNRENTRKALFLFIEGLDIDPKNLGLIQMFTIISSFYLKFYRDDIISGLRDRWLEVLKELQPRFAEQVRKIIP
ncbi:hypothetical protein HYU13_03915 [Candidatus Woesearchaeota archaeon]|nr:hypothetical protein [Candidatus Woesearchaeota archaeon]